MVERTVYISFSAQLNKDSIQRLIGAVEKTVTERKPTKFVLLLSALQPEGYSNPEEYVEAAITGYNFLKSLPVDVQTHNLTHLDLVSMTLFCAGEKRTTAPHATFLLRDLKWRGNYTARELKALLQRVGVHRKNIFSVLAGITGKSTKEIERIITKEATISAEEAQKFGLVHEIRELRVEKGGKLVSIG